MKNIASIRRGLSIALFVTPLFVWALFLHEFRLDDSFITYRYARNVAEGLGLVYNAGEWVLSTTAPLYALLLAVLSFIIADFHILGGLVGALAIGAGGLLLVDVLRQSVADAVGWGVGVVYVLASPLWLALGMETALWIAFVIAGLALIQRNRWGMAGALMGLAMLTRPDAVLAGALMGMVALAVGVLRRATTRHPYRHIIAYGAWASAPVLVFYGWAWLTYGSPFPATLSAKSSQAILGVTGLGYGVTPAMGLYDIVDSLLWQSPLYLVVGLLMALGVWRWRSHWASLLVVWGVAHFGAYLVLGVSPYRWYYVPMLAGTLVLVAYGADALYQRSRWLAMGALALVLIAQMTSFAHIERYMRQGGALQAMLPVVDWDAYRTAGEWLDAHAPPDALVGVAEVGQLGFYARRTMTDYLGLLQPEVAQWLRRDDLYSWLVGYAPDYLVFQRFGGGVGLSLYNRYIGDDVFFTHHYREGITVHDTRYQMGPVTVFERVTPRSALREHVTERAFGGLMLTGWAHDADLHAGDVVRLRLDWRIMRDDLPRRLQITLELSHDHDGAPIKSDNGYDTRHWGTVGASLTNWHALALPSDLPSGAYDVRLIVWDAESDAHVADVIGVMTVAQ